MEAVLLQDSEQFLIVKDGEIIPLIRSTSNINLPVIINNIPSDKIEVFSNACNNNKLFSALKILSAAELFDNRLHENISEINIKENNLSLTLTDFSSPIYFGNSNEIEKTVFLSKIFSHIKQNKFNDYLDYIDLRYTNLVYLGFDEKYITDKENI
jgi:hypothetical protein